MNKERLKIISDWLRGGAKYVDDKDNVYTFNMNYWKAPAEEVLKEDIQPWNTDCGTFMCIGGAVQQFFGDKDRLTYARELLDLDYETSEALFYPEGFSVMDWSYITPNQAADVIDHLIETGEVDWSIARG